MTKIIDQAPQGPTIDRRSYLGGSEIGAVAGLNRYKSPLDVWATKRPDLIEGELDDGPKHKADVGNALERPVLERLYAPRLKVETLRYPGTIRHPRHSWAGTSPDAIADERVDVQCKIVGDRQWHRWSESQEDGPDGIPPEVLAQVQWEMWIADLGVAHVPALFGTDLRVYTVPRDEELIEMLVGVASAFWDRCVVGGAMPELEGASSERRVIEARFPHARRGLEQASSDFEALARSYRLAADEVEAAEREKERLGNELRAALGEREGVYGDFGRVYWRDEKGRPSWKAIAEELGAPANVIAKHTGEGGRVLRVHVRSKATAQERSVAA